MKIGIELSKEEIAGIKKYLKEIGEIDRPTKADVGEFIRGEMNGLLYMCTAVSDYVLAEVEKSNSKNQNQ